MLRCGWDEEQDGQNADSEYKQLHSHHARGKTYVFRTSTRVPSQRSTNCGGRGVWSSKLIRYTGVYDIDVPFISHSRFQGEVQKITMTLLETAPMKRKMPTYNVRSTPFLDNGKEEITPLVVSVCSLRFEVRVRRFQVQFIP